MGIIRDRACASPRASPADPNRELLDELNFLRPPEVTLNAARARRNHNGYPQCRPSFLEKSPAPGWEPRRLWVPHLVRLPGRIGSRKGVLEGHLYSARMFLQNPRLDPQYRLAVNANKRPGWPLDESSASDIQLLVEITSCHDITSRSRIRCAAACSSMSHPVEFHNPMSFD